MSPPFSFNKIYLDLIKLVRPKQRAGESTSRYGLVQSTLKNGKGKGEKEKGEGENVKKDKGEKGKRKNK